MFKGGYKLIDFKENNIVLSTPTTITNEDAVTITENTITLA